MAVETVDIIVNLQNNVSPSARAAAESLRSLRDVARECRLELRRLERQAHQTANALYRLAAAARIARTQLGSLRNTLITTAAAQRRLGAATRDSTREHTKHVGVVRRVINTFRMFGSIFGRVLGMVAKGVKWLAFLTAGFTVVGLAAQTAAGMQQIAGFTASLGSLIAYAAYAPLVLGGLVAAFATVKIATKGMGDAIGAALSGDWQKLGEALEGLTPAAREFVKPFAEVSDRFKTLKANIQETFFTPMVGKVAPALNNILTVLEERMNVLAGLMGNIGATFLNFAASKSGANMVATSFMAAEKFMQELNDGLGPLLQGISDLMVNVTDHFSSMIGGMGEGLAGLGNWLTLISTNGQLDQWLSNASTTLTGLWNVLKGVWGILQALGPLYRGSAESWGNALMEVAAVLKGSESQAIITAIGDTIDQMVLAFKPSLGALMRVIGTMAQIIGDAFFALAPKMELVINAFNDGFKNILPAATPFFTGVGDLITALLPTLPLLGAIIGALATVVGVAASKLSEYVTPVFQWIGENVTPVFMNIINALTGMGNAAGGVFSGSGSAFVETLKNLVGLFAGNVMDAFKSVWPSIKSAMDQVVPTLKVVVDGYKEFLQKIIPALIPFVQALINVWKAIVPVFAAVIEVLFKLIREAFPYLVDGMAPIVSMILRVVTVALNMLVPVFKVIAWIIQNILWPALKIVIDVLGTLFAKFGSIVGYLDSVFEGALKQVSKSFDPVKDAVGIFIDVVKGIWDFIKPGVDNVVSGFTSAFNGVKNVISGVIDFIQGGLKGAVETVLDALIAVASWDFPGNPFAGFENNLRSLRAEINAVQGAQTQVGNGVSTTTGLNSLGGVSARAMGGPVAPGSTYLVGEIGKELFVPSNGGAPKVIGANGMGLMNFNTPGVVVPNHMLAAYDKMSKSNALRTSLNQGSGSIAAVSTGSSYTINEGPTSISLAAETRDAFTPQQLQRAITKGLRDARRSAIERA